MRKKVEKSCNMTPTWEIHQPPAGVDMAPSPPQTPPLIYIFFYYMKRPCAVPALPVIHRPLGVQCVGV